MAEAAPGSLVTERFQRAVALALEIHGTKRRKSSQVPRLADLISAAALVREYGGDEDAAVSALLHDAIQSSSDGRQAEARIRREFGSRVADIVWCCSDTVGIPGEPKPTWATRKTMLILRLATEDDPDVMLVSACNELHKLRSIVAGLRAVGHVMWDSFVERDAAAQVWYHQSLAMAYEGCIPAGLYGELDRALAVMQFLCNASGTDLRR